MSDRDELAAMVGESIQEKLLDDCPDYWPDTKEWGESIADAILAAGYRPQARAITKQGELEEVVQRAFEDGHWLVVQSGIRPWIIVEDEDGDAWAWSWLEEDEARSCIAAESLPLPVTVLHEGEA